MATVTPKEPVWTDAKGFPLESQPQGTKARFSPQTFALLDRFYVVWVDYNTGRLNWSVEEDGGKWSDAFTLRGSFATDVVTASPSVSVLDGKAHLVYARTFEGWDQLFHLQFDASTRTWGQRCSLGVRPRKPTPPSLGAFASTLHCVYRNDMTNAMTLVRWTESEGWGNPSAMEGVVLTSTESALFELDNALHLLIVGNEGSAENWIQHFSYNSGADSWTDRGRIGNDWKSFVGIAAASVNDKVFATYCNNTYMVTAQCVEGEWSMTMNKKPATRTPSIAVEGNQVIIVRSTVAEAWITWLDRRVLDIPKLESWMADVSPQLRISALTIPGAHDAGANSAVPFLGTQSTDITSLLNMGIRYLDIRTVYQRDDLDEWSHEPPQFFIGHGPFLIDRGWNDPLLLDDVLDACYKFLKRQGTEGLLMQISNEAAGALIDQGAEFAAALKDKISEHPDRWLTTANVPTMSNLKGKIQLLRRYSSTEEFGIDMSRDWKKNSIQPFSIKSATDPPFQVNIQDYFSPSAAPQLTPSDVKWRAVNNQLIAASTDTSDNLYLNFASATDYKSLSTPWYFAVGEMVGYQKILGQNDRLKAFFNAVKEAKRYGVVLLDYPGAVDELVLAMVKTNYEGQYKKAKK